MNVEQRFEAWWNRADALLALSDASKNLAKSIWLEAVADAAFAVAPWYPDDSGAWIEVPDTQMTAPDLPTGTTVDVLLAGERARREVEICTMAVDDWAWNTRQGYEFRIVAYKVVPDPAGDSKGAGC